VDAGTLSFAGATSTGAGFTVAAGATLDLTGGTTTTTLTGTYGGSGDGTVLLASGRLNVGTAGATFDFDPGLFQWTGGTLAGGSAGLTNVGTITLSGAGAAVLNGRLINHGTLTQVGAGSFQVPSGATLDNRDDGTVDLESDAGIAPSGTSRGTVLNAGVFDKSGGGGESLVGVTVNNTGAVEVIAGTLTLGSTVTQVSGSTLTGGTWYVFDGAVLNLTAGANLATNNATVGLFGGGSFPKIDRLTRNTGSLFLLGGATFTTAGAFANAGVIVLDAASALTVQGGFTQTAGYTALGGGTLTASGAVSVQGGGLGGPGVVNANLVNAGEVDVNGLLVVTGDFTQTAAGVLYVQIGGRTAGVDYDQLAVAGRATLNGTLAVALVNDFVPMPGDTFTVLTFGSLAGTFPVVTLFTPVYGSNDLTLV
jgi:hypothetical protein